jgi:hypothetical protein
LEDIMSSRLFYPSVAIGVATLFASVVGVAPAQAGGGDFTEETGACSMVSRWDMKAKPVAARRIEMEFSVDSNRLGQAWAVRVTNNGTLLFSGTRTTNGISRSFSVDKMLANRAGTDRMVVRATNAKTGEVCRGHVALGAAGGGSGQG